MWQESVRPNLNALKLLQPSDPTHYEPSRTVRDSKGNAIDLSHTDLILNGHAIVELLSGRDERSVKVEDFSYKGSLYYTLSRNGDEWILSQTMVHLYGDSENTGTDSSS